MKWRREDSGRGERLKGAREEMMKGGRREKRDRGGVRGGEWLKGGGRRG